MDMYGYGYGYGYEDMDQYGQRFGGWAEQECNEFLRQLEVSEPDFVAEFYQAVAATAGKERKALKIKEDSQR